MLGLLLPVLGAAAPARAPKAAPAAQDPFNELFDTACMQHIGAPARLQSLMEANGLSPLQPAEAAGLLQGQSGVAWLVPLASGRYAVSWADDGTCSVYAEKAEPAVVQKGFARLVQAAPKPLQVRSLPGRGPLSADQVAIQYGWATPGDARLRVRFRLVTRQAAEAGVQAMASVSPGEAMVEQAPTPQPGAGLPGAPQPEPGTTR